MTTWTIKVTPPEGSSDLADLMAELDALPKAPRSAPAKKAAPTAPKAPPAEPVFVQQWFPRALVSHTHEQTCHCGMQYTSVTGLFLEDQHRNGALRQTRHTKAIPFDYMQLPRRKESTHEELAGCPDCEAYTFEMQLNGTMTELDRALSQDDLNSLKETDNG